MRFVHAADLHLDSPLSGLAPYEGAPIEEVRGATRRALQGLVDLCLEERVDLLLIAGDLYDGEWKDFSTGLFFLQQMDRLAELGTRVVWVRGNHDAASRITRFLRPPPHVRELSVKAPETVVFEQLGVAVHGMGYVTRDVTENLAVRYPPACPGMLNIGLLHTALDGRPGHAGYAPCYLSDLLSQGYDYWALGHVHQREVIHERPWVVFPGNLQGRHIGETGPKGATLVEVHAGSIVRVEPRCVDVVRWELVRFDVTGLESVDTIVEQTLQVVAQAERQAGDRTLAVRIELHGKSRYHGELLADRERLLAQLRLEAHSLGSVYLEDLRVQVLPTLDLDALRHRRDTLGELFSEIRSKIEGELREPKELSDELVSGLTGVPSDVRRELLARQREIWEEAEQLLVARLLESGESG